jgi:SAM-dependent methyltransferase
MRRFYPPERGWVDGTTEFHDLCTDTVRSGSLILEIGAGPSNDSSRHFARIGTLHGVDPDPDVAGNDALVSSGVLDAKGVMPYADSSFDACVSNYVAEHVADPLAHLREVRRVLRPGGLYIFRTPNVRHFVYRAASLTPHVVHTTLSNRLRALPPDAHEPYPTVYALNSASTIRQAAGMAGLSVDLLRFIEKEPSYGMASRALFLPFLAYERVVNATDRLAAFRSTILAVLSRPTEALATR